MTERGELSSNNFSELYEFDSFRLDAAARHLRQNNQPVKLTSKAFDILVYLVRRRGEVVAREELLENVWSDAFVEDANLSVHIAALRKILGDTQSEARFIATVPRRGYCFVARVRDIHEAEKNLPPEETIGRREISLAVLPLRAIGQNEELEYLADGITENLINALSRLPQLKVFATSAIFRYKNDEKDTSAIGRALGATVILTGRVRSFYEELVVTVELVRVEDNRQLWGAQYHQPLADIFELQEKIALAITEKLLPQLTEAEKSLLENRQTENSEAYRALLKGRYFLSKLTTDGIKKALRYFEKAVELDPDYALAYVRIGLGNYYLNSRYQISYDEALRFVSQAINRAFEIDPHLAEAHSLSAIFKSVYEWDNEAAEREFRLAVELNPNSTFTRGAYSNCLTLFGRFEEAHEQLEKALEIDPLSLSLNVMVGSTLFCERRYEEAIVHLQQVLEMYPDSFISHVLISLSFQELGDSETALAKMKTAYELESNMELSALLGAALANARQTDEALRILNEIEQSDVRKPFETFYLYLALDKIDEAIAFVEKSLAQREVEHLGLNVDARADKIRSDARFKKILKRMGFSG